MLCSYIWLKTLQGEAQEVAQAESQAEAHAKDKQLQDMKMTASTSMINDILKTHIDVPYDNYTLYKLLLEQLVIKFLIDEMKKFELEIVYELFYILDINDMYKPDTHNHIDVDKITPLTQAVYDKKALKKQYVLLFIQRIINFISAYEHYTGKPLKKISPQEIN